MEESPLRRMEKEFNDLSSGSPVGKGPGGACFGRITPEGWGRGSLSPFSPIPAAERRRVAHSLVWRHVNMSCWGDRSRTRLRGIIVDVQWPRRVVLDPGPDSPMTEVPSASCFLPRHRRISVHPTVAAQVVAQIAWRRPREASLQAIRPFTLIGTASPSRIAWGVY